MSRHHLEAYSRYFETLSPDLLSNLGDYFAHGARFCDPFNDVSGIPAIRQVFEHMYRTTREPRFEVNEQILEGQVAYLRWRFYFRPPRARTQWTIEGVSRVTFDKEGKVVEHRDYWDAASQLYARMPVVGWLMRWLQARLVAA